MANSFYLNEPAYRQIREERVIGATFAQQFEGNLRDSRG
jgi:hypothetical protein